MCLFVPNAQTMRWGLQEAASCTVWSATMSLEEAVCWRLRFTARTIKSGMCWCFVHPFWDFRPRKTMPQSFQEVETTRIMSGAREEGIWCYYRETESSSRGSLGRRMNQQNMGEHRLFPVSNRQSALLFKAQQLSLSALTACLLLLTVAIRKHFNSGAEGVPLYCPRPLLCVIICL